MDKVQDRFSEAAGFDADQIVVLVLSIGFACVFLWACWCALGQFQLWAKGEIEIGQLFFGALRVVGVLMGVSYLLSLATS